MTLLLFAPNDCLSHLDYAPVHAENSHRVEEGDGELTDSLEALSVLHKELAISLATLISEAHQHGELVLNENAINLHSKENAQAIIKSSLRLFLQQISAAFKSLLQGFQSSAPSPDSASLAISVSNDVDPLESEKMAKEMEVDGKHEEGEIEAFFIKVNQVYEEMVFILVGAKAQMDSQFSEELDRMKQTHRLREEKNEQARQSILHFIATIETATQALLADKEGDQQPPPYSE